MTAPLTRWIVALLLATLAMGMVLVHAARAAPEGARLALHPNAAAAATTLDRQAGDELTADHRNAII